MTLFTVEPDFKKYLLFVPSLRRMFSLSVLTLSLWNGFKKLPAISPSSRGVPGGLFMPAMLLGEFCNMGIRKSKNTFALTDKELQRYKINMEYRKHHCFFCLNRCFCKNPPIYFTSQT